MSKPARVDVATQVAFVVHGESSEQTSGGELTSGGAIKGSKKWRKKGGHVIDTAMP